MSLAAKETWERISKNYKSTWAGYMCKRASPTMLELSNMKNTDKVLEIGAGDGNLTNIILQKYNDIDITVTDYSENMCELLKKVNFQNNVIKEVHSRKCKNTNSKCRRFILF
jgi:16S rRNA A1518/A1519 N6-dimethyltransferase RsmA/KsgA/DIM1 with predicted DNA glycosylase/AP lyase activity